MDETAIAKLRDFYRTFGDLPLPEGMSVSSTSLGGVPALAVEPSSAVPPSGTILYLHGGGYVLGSARTGVPLAARLAAGAGMRAISLDYRLAPEHRHPAAFDDASRAYEALLADEDPARLAVAGDSAGAGLALATLLAARDRGLPLAAAYVAFSGWFDLTLGGGSLRSKEAVDPVFDASDIRDYAFLYLGDANPAQTSASPLHADLAGLPPLLLQVGTHEVLLDDSTALATRAAHADVDVRLEAYAGQAHVFHHQHATDPTAARAMDSAAAFLVDALRNR